MGNGQFVYINIKLLFDRDILNFFHFSLDGNHFDLLLWNYLFNILLYILNRVVICFDHFSGNFFYHYPLFILNNFSFDWNSLDILPLFILDYFFLIRHISNSALPYVIINCTLNFFSSSHWNTNYSAHIILSESYLGLLRK